MRKLLTLIVLAVLLLASVRAADVVIVEPVTSCIKAPYNSNIPLLGIVNLFLGEKMDVTLNPNGPNYASLNLQSTLGNGRFLVGDVSPDSNTLIETVCGNGYGSQYSGFGGMLRYTLSEIESTYGLTQNSLYLERYVMVPGLYPEIRSPFAAYLIPGATSYITSESTPGSSITYVTSSNIQTPQGTFRNVFATVEPHDINTAISYINVIGPLPSTNTPLIIGGSNPTGNGQAMTIDFQVPVNAGMNDVYHIQARDSNGVGVTEWVVITS